MNCIPHKWVMYYTFRKISLRILTTISSLTEPSRFIYLANLNTNEELCLLQEIVLREGSQAFGWWKTPPVMPEMKVYVFNVTNADEFLNNGSKPIVEELGPYVY